MKLLGIIFAFCFYLNKPSCAAEQIPNELLIGTRNATRFMDLNFDCQTTIFEQMTFMQLLSLSEVNKQCLSVVEGIMRAKFVKKPLFIGSPYHDEAVLRPDHYQCETEERIEISYLSLVLKILTRFGDSISVVVILNHYDLYQTNISMKVFDLVNVHCSKSLKQLHVLSKNGNPFEAFKKPFEKVVHLRLDGTFTRLDNDNLSFTEIFPSIRSLSLMAIAPENSSVFHEQMPHLEGLQINNGNFYRNNSIKQLIANNPKIRELLLQCVDADLLRHVADGLPQLKYLEIEDYVEGVGAGAILHFEQLKTFKMKGSHHTLPLNADFRDLESFEIDDTARMCTRWIELVESQRSLKRLRAVRMLNNNEIKRLANANLNLVEIMFLCDRYVDFENVIQFIESAKELKIMFLFIREDRVRQSAVDLLQNHFEHDWEVKSISEVVIFSKK